MPKTPPYLTWDTNTGVYRNAKGEHVSQSDALAGNYSGGLLHPWGEKKAVAPVEDPYAVSAVGGASGPNNPFGTISNVKSKAVDDRLGGLFKSFDELGKANQDSLAKYSGAVDEATPAINRATGSDTGNIDFVSGNGLSDMLATIRNHRAQALGQVVQRSLGDSKRMLSSNQLTMGGGGRALGTGSYMQGLALSKAADINAKAAMDDAEQERADQNFITQSKLGSVGQRQNLALIPSQANLLGVTERQKMLAGLSSSLGQLGSQNLTNTFYGIAKHPGIDPTQTVQNNQASATTQSNYMGGSN